MRGKTFTVVFIVVLLLSFLSVLLTHRYMVVDLDSINDVVETKTIPTTGEYIKKRNDEAEAVLAAAKAAAVSSPDDSSFAVIEMNMNSNSNTTTTANDNINDNTNTNSNTNLKPMSQMRFAYAFLIAGCDPTKPSYKGYIYNVAVAKQMLVNYGSGVAGKNNNNNSNINVDVVVMIRMHEKSTSDKILPEDEAILTGMGIVIKYLPRALTDNFHTAMMDKFRILQLTDYDRVLYLDADVIPLSNLDFMFTLSSGQNAPLQENVGLAYNREPTNGGFFMLKPSEEDYQHILEIIEKREREGYHFNETIGWGHQMIPPDGWESLKGYEGSKWDFYGSFTDQGLIYYWTKYVKKKVSIINKDRVKTYLEGPNGEVELVRDDDGSQIFAHVKKGKEDVETNHHSRKAFRLTTTVPYRDFHHFKESTKPWIKHKFKSDTGPQEYWFDTLRAINDEHKFGIDVDELLNVGLKKPDLGLFPTYNMIEETKNKRKKEDEKAEQAEQAEEVVVEAKNEVEETRSVESVESKDVATETTEVATVSVETTEAVEPVKSTGGKFAYAFLIAGCDPRKPNYRGYIYSVAVAKQALIDFGSTSDVVVMIRMHQNVRDEILPKHDEDVLTGMGIIVKYIPRALMDNFHTAMMDKFRILQLTEYDRVLYLDADIIPLSNLDFMFELSTGPNAPLEENVGLAYNREPTNGGFFMLKPNEEDYQHIIQIIEKREREGYHFNETIGWGHQMVPPDCWESLNGPQGSKWDFYGAFTDQGLIYYWTKYVKKKVTLIVGRRIKTYLENADGNVVLVRDEDGDEIFRNVKKGVEGVITNHHSRTSFTLPKIIPYRDFHHFKEKFKPWLTNASDKVDRGPHQFWYSVLDKLNEEHKFGIDTKRFDNFRQPNLGLYPRYTMIEDMKQLREAKDKEEEEAKRLGGSEEITE